MATSYINLMTAINELENYSWYNYCKLRKIKNKCGSEYIFASTLYIYFLDFDLNSFMNFLYRSIFFASTIGLKNGSI